MPLLLRILLLLCLVVMFGGLGKRSSSSVDNVNGHDVPNKKQQCQETAAVPVTLKLVAWNINGLARLVGKKNGYALQRMVAEWEFPAVICFEETKLQEHEVQKFFDILSGLGYISFWKCSTAESRKGRDGVVTFVRGTGSVEALTIARQSALGNIKTLPPTKYFKLAPELENIQLPPTGLHIERVTFQLGTNNFFSRYGNTVVVYLRNKMVIANVYRPNTCTVPNQYKQRKLDDVEFRQEIKKLEVDRLVIIVGDFCRGLPSASS